MATVNVTKVVERGSLREVPRAIRREDTTKLTAALIWSNAAPLTRMASSLLKRLSIQLRTLRGVTFSSHVAKELAICTRRRPVAEVPKEASDSFWLVRLTSVLITLRAFREVAKANTMVAPESIRNIIGVWAGSSRLPIR